MALYLLDLIGVAVFAVSGALAAGRARLDLFGVVVIASITAIGGGSLRDVLLDRHPIFWIRDPVYLLVPTLAALGTIAYVRLVRVPSQALIVADALGLALFAMAGARIAEGAGLSPAIVVLMGTITGVAGGVLRDLLTAQVPLIFREDIYATAAIAGIALYLALAWLGVPGPWRFAAGLVAIAALRLSAILWKLRLPVFQLPQ